MFDEQPDGNTHVECAAEIARLNAEIQKCIAVLPGPFYMDLPDGGDVPISEQFLRMAQDAARFRWLMDHPMYPTWKMVAAAREHQSRVKLIDELMAKRKPMISDDPPWWHEQIAKEAASSKEMMDAQNGYTKHTLTVVRAAHDYVKSRNEDTLYKLVSAVEGAGS